MLLDPCMVQMHTVQQEALTWGAYLTQRGLNAEECAELGCEQYLFHFDRLAFSVSCSCSVGKSARAETSCGYFCH